MLNANAVDTAHYILPVDRRKHGFVLLFDGWCVDTYAYRYNTYIRTHIAIN